METPLEYLEKRLNQLRFIANTRGFSKVKKDAIKSIPEYKNAVNLLKSKK